MKYSKLFLLSSSFFSLFFISGCGVKAESLLPSRTLVESERIEVRPASTEQCPYGGNELLTYLDANGNNLRDDNEEPRSSFLVCTAKNGTDGNDGTDGKDGSDGTDGADGKDGVDGKDAPVPVPTPTPTPTPKPTPTRESCQVVIKPSSIWNEGYVVDVYVIQLGKSIDSWVVEFKLPAKQRITDIWNAKAESAEGKVKVRNMSYNGTVKTNEALTFGMKVERKNSSLLSASTFKLNGVKCHK